MKRKKYKHKGDDMSQTLQIQLPGQTIPVKNVQIKTDIPKVVEILKTIASGKD